MNGLERLCLFRAHEVPTSSSDTKPESGQGGSAVVLIAYTLTYSSECRRLWTRTIRQTFFPAKGSGGARVHRIPVQLCT
jgi:hypothetical protein